MEMCPREFCKGALVPSDTYRIGSRQVIERRCTLCDRSPDDAWHREIAEHEALMQLKKRAPGVDRRAGRKMSPYRTFKKRGAA